MQVIQHTHSPRSPARLGTATQTVTNSLRYYNTHSYHRLADADDVHVHVYLCELRGLAGAGLAHDDVPV